MCLGSLRDMKHPLIVQMHPDGVFVFLSLLIYGGLFYTQKKKFTFQFPLLVFLLTALQFWKGACILVPPSCPHCCGIGEDTRMGVLQALLYGSKAHAAMISGEIYLCSCPARTPGVFGAVSQSFLHTVMKGEGNSPVSCLVPNTGPCLHTHCGKQQPTKEQGRLGMPTPLSTPLLQGWQEDKQEALETRPFLVSCRFVPVLG